MHVVDVFEPVRGRLYGVLHGLVALEVGASDNRAETKREISRFCASSKPQRTAGFDPLETLTSLGMRARCIKQADAPSASRIVARVPFWGRMATLAM